MGAGEGRAAEAVSLLVIWSDEAKAEFYDAERWYAEFSPATLLAEPPELSVETRLSALQVRSVGRPQAAPKCSNM
jgi:plasmid stabilization system protein ParE